MPIAAAGSWLEIVAAILRIAERVVTIAETAKQQKKRCSLLRERVGFIAKLLEELKGTKWTPDQASHAILEHLGNAIDSAQQLVEACQRKKMPWKYLLFGTGKMDGQFADLHAQIDQAMQPFLITNLIVLLTLNHESFFINVLEKLLRDGACKRLPQGDKDDIKRNISGLSERDRDRMSPNAKKMLELIINDLRLGEADTWGASSVNLHQGRGGSSESTDQLKQVENIAKEILELQKVDHAVKQSKEVQWLAKLAQQVVQLTQHPLAPQMMRHREAPDHPQPMDDLLHDLEEARDLVIPKSNQPSGGLGVSISATMKATAIYKVGYKIEYNLQVLPIVTMRDMDNA